MGIGDHGRNCALRYYPICRRDTQWELATNRFESYRIYYVSVGEIPNGNWRRKRQISDLLIAPRVGEIPNGNWRQQKP